MILLIKAEPMFQLKSLKSKSSDSYDCHVKSRCYTEYSGLCECITLLEFFCGVTLCFQLIEMHGIVVVSATWTIILPMCALAKFGNKELEYLRK